MSKQLSQKMLWSKSTKGTHVYNALASDKAPAVTTVYVNKQALGDKAPDMITLSIDVETGEVEVDHG